jgi:DNA-binding NtrC family response regulator
MARDRVLLLEDNVVLADVLRDLLDDEDLDVTVCRSLPELQRAMGQNPLAVVVTDSWTRSSETTLTPEHRQEILALAQTAEVILTTGRGWAHEIPAGDLGPVAIVNKPYDLERLIAAVRAALERAVRRRESGLSRAALQLEPAGPAAICDHRAP